MTALIFFALIFAVLEWIGEHKKIDLLIFISKPLVIIFTILWITANADVHQILVDGFNFRLTWFIIGLLLCLIGDVLLMLPDRFFVSGLTFFLFGHISYIFGFGRIIPPTGSFIPGMILAVLVIIVSGRVYRVLALEFDKNRMKRLKFFIVAYTILISIMLYSALLTLLNKEWDYSAALLISLGAILFYISDVLNAWNRFVETLPAGRLKIMLTYHLAQISLAIGAALHFTFKGKT